MGFVICSRLKSVRVPNKCLTLINGIPLLGHLLKRVKQLNLPVILAVPFDEVDSFKEIANEYDVTLFSGSEIDPLLRMYDAARDNNLEHVIRVCHDKVFIDEDLVQDAISSYFMIGADYLYSKEFTEGTGFEIISFEALKKARYRFQNVEHISYAIKAVAQHIEEHHVPNYAKSDFRLLIDYEKDLLMMETILSTLGNDCTMDDALMFLKANRGLKQLNEIPQVTIYTCAFNADKYIAECIDSVTAQSGFENMEYLIIDDGSSDKTFYHMAKAAVDFDNVKLFKNHSNKGLAASSNMMLSKARGRYIMRVDADDYFTSQNSINNMLTKIRSTDFDVIYPDNYFGAMDLIQQGCENHHIGGALFDTKALNHVKFTDRLTGHDSLDVYLRSKQFLKTGYLKEPIFFYRQHEKSLTHMNLEYREAIRQQLIAEAELETN